MASGFRLLVLVLAVLLIIQIAQPFGFAKKSSEAGDDSGAAVATEDDVAALGKGAKSAAVEEEAAPPKTKKKKSKKKSSKEPKPSGGEAAVSDEPAVDDGSSDAKEEEQVKEKESDGVKTEKKEAAAAVATKGAAAATAGTAVSEDEMVVDKEKLATFRKFADIDPKGNCSKEIKKHCKDVQAGGAANANCIADLVRNEATGNILGGKPVSKKCKAEVRAFKVEMYKDLSLDKAMEAACQKDITKFCDDDFLYPEPGNIVACLREVDQVEKVSDGCKAEILRAKLDAAEDIKMDPQLNELCGGEVDRLCRGVQPGEGRVQSCLREHMNVLAWDCLAELFRQEVENADDIRLNFKLFQACLLDQRRFCADVKYGDARVKDCLEENRNDPDFSPRCKTEFEKMMERRASDFRLDSNLRKYCKNDISEICYPDAEDITDVANWDAKVIQCLQDYHEELRNPKCKKEVHKLTKRAAEDIRFDKPLADACYADRQTVCKDVPDGMAQIFLCLQSNSEKLKEPCRVAIFEQLQRMAEDIDYKFPMKRACGKELKLFCADIPQGHAARVKCLQEKMDDADMGEECRKEVKRDMIRAAEDYRLNYRLHKACLVDVQKKCSHACDKQQEEGAVSCGGTVLKCLQENIDHLESESCKKEVFSFSSLESKDLQLDVPLQAACKGDLAKLCPEVSKDHSRTLACLRSKREKLTEECKAEEMRFSIMEASDIRLTPSLMNACGQELQTFCKEASPEGGTAFKCLQEHLEEVGMGAACKGEVNLQEARHASNYRLDVRVRKECEADVAAVCPEADFGHEGHALVLKCMVANYKKLSGSCQTEVTYAVRMALMQYKRGAELTGACDANIDAVCPAAKDAKEINGVVIGVIGQCLISSKKANLDEECRTLVKLAAKEGAHVGGVVDEARLVETLKKIEELQAAAAAAASAGGGDSLESHGLVLGGWIAFAAIVSLVVVVLAVAYGIYARFFSPHRNYTLVVKGTGGV